MLLRFVTCSLIILISLQSRALADSGAKDGFRALDPARTVYLDLPDGRVVIDLNPDFAPKHVAQFLSLVRKGFFDGLSFYRVIDGFVAQGGDGSDLTGETRQPMLPAEFERSWSKNLSWTSVQKNDLFADETGFIDGFAAARDVEEGRVWLTHCPGVIALARNNDPHSASTDFYIVIGQAPRYLDRNLTILGRVVQGMELVQMIRRGSKGNDGVLEDEKQRTPIVKMKVAVDLPIAERLAIEVIDTSTELFGKTLSSRRHRDHEFFHHKPPPVLDVCQVPVATNSKP